MKQNFITKFIVGCVAAWSMFDTLPLRAGQVHHHHDHRHLGLSGGDAQNDALLDSHTDGPIGSFVLQGGRWDQPGGPDSPVHITYSYNNLLDGGLLRADGTSVPVDLIRGSVEEALGLWASVAPLHFVEVEDEGGPVVVGNYPDGQYGQIRFHHLWINGPDGPGQPPTTKAQAFFPQVTGNHQADVYYDNGDPWEEIGSLSRPDILGAAVHEIGHTLGLGHTAVEGANMYWIFRRTAGLGTASLHEDDIAGIQTLYGTAPGSVTPLPFPVPEPASWILAGWLASALSIRRRVLTNCAQ